jgi:hypothetical protein
LSNVPGPLEPFGQSLRSGSGADALGAGALTVAGAEATGAADAAASTPWAGSSFEQAVNPTASTNDVIAAPILRFVILRTVLSQPGRDQPPSDVRGRRSPLPMTQSKSPFAIARS